MRKACFLTFLGLISIIRMNAQSWTLKKDIPNTPTSGRWSPVCFSVFDKIYVGGGYTGNFIAATDFWEYDPVTNDWTQKEDLPGPANRTAGIAFSGNGKGYVGLGSVDYNTIQSSFLDDLWQYDPVNNQWTQMASLPDSGRQHAACFVMNNTAYVVGGTTGYPYVASNDLWAYDIVNNVWNPKEPFPATYIHDAMAFSAGDYGYIVGGHVKQFGATNDGDADSATWRYDIPGNSWSKKADYCGRREGGVGFSLMGLGYVGFGSAKFPTYTSYYEEFCRYDPAEDEWEPIPSYPNIARTYAVAAVANGKAYAGAGFLYLTSEMYQHDWAELTPGSTGVAALNSIGVSIHPNPADHVTNIRISQAADAILTDTYGRTIQTIQLKAGSNTINVSELAEGMYFLRTEEGSAKLQVMH